MSTYSGATECGVLESVLESVSLKALWFPQPDMGVHCGTVREPDSL